MENGIVDPNAEDNAKNQGWSNDYVARQHVIKPRRYVIKSGLSLLGLFLINLLSKSNIFTRCIERGFNESDSSCYGLGIAFAAICAFRYVLAIVPTAYMILILIGLKKTPKEQRKAMLPYIIISTILAVVAIAYFIGIFFEVF